MPRTPSNIKLLQLVVLSVKESRRLIALGDDFSYMRAVFSLDFAVEQMLNILIDNFATNTSLFEKDKPPSWKELWQVATVAVKEEGMLKQIPHYKQLIKLHSIRNLSQHHGCTPHSSDVSPLVTPVENMLSTCFKECFGLHFEYFRLWDMIQNLCLRELLTQCEQALDKGKPGKSLAGAIMAFDQITSEFLKELPVSSTPHFRHYEDERRWEEWISGARKSLNQLHVGSVLASLGLPIAETQRFHRLASEISVTLMASGDWRVTIQPRTFEEFKVITPHSLYQNPKNLILGAYWLGLATSWSVQQPYSLVMGDCPLIVKMTCDLVCTYNTNTY